MSSVHASLHYTVTGENLKVCQQILDLVTVSVKWEFPEPLQRIATNWISQILMQVLKNKFKDG